MLQIIYFRLIVHLTLNNVIINVPNAQCARTHLIIRLFIIVLAGAAHFNKLVLNSICEIYDTKYTKGSRSF